VDSEKWSIFKINIIFSHYHQSCWILQTPVIWFRQSNTAHCKNVHVGKIQRSCKSLEVWQWPCNLWMWLYMEKSTLVNIIKHLEMISLSWVIWEGPNKDTCLLRVKQRILDRHTAERASEEIGNDGIAHKCFGSHWELEHRNRLFLRTPKGKKCISTKIWTSSLQNCETMEFCWFQVTQFRVIYYSSLANKYTRFAFFCYMNLWELSLHFYRFQGPCFFKNVFN
jgi:hypothetical protein